MKYQKGPSLSSGGDRSQLIISDIYIIYIKSPKEIIIYIISSVRLKNQLEVYYKQAFDSYVNLPQA